MFEASFWTWLIFAAVLIVLELSMPIYYFLWLGVTSATVGVIVWLFPHMDITWQLALFSILGIFSVLGVRAFIRKNSTHDEESILNRRAEQYVGRILTLEEAIVNGEAKVRVDGMTWKVVGPDSPEGTKVKAISIHQKSVLVVEIED